MIIKFSSPFRLAAAGLRAIWAKLFGYAVLAPTEIWDERLDKCLECEELVNNQCRICTCDVEAKACLALEQCPKKKWKRVWLKKHTF